MNSLSREAGEGGVGGSQPPCATSFANSAN